LPGTEGWEVEVKKKETGLVEKRPMEKGDSCITKKGARKREVSQIGVSRKAKKTAVKKKMAQAYQSQNLLK